MSIRATAFFSFHISMHVSRGFVWKKVGFHRFFALKSSFKVPALATPKEVNCESVQKRVSVPEWVLMSCQEGPTPASSCRYCFINGEEFFFDINMHVEVVKQNKNTKLQEAPEVISLVSNLSLCGKPH